MIKKLNIETKKILVGVLTTLSILSTSAPVIAHAEWNSNSNGWWYNQGSSWATGWNEIDGQWYYFDTNGYMKKGWLKDGANWYYLAPSGEMARDCYVGDYHLNPQGILDYSKLQSDKMVASIPASWTKTILGNITTYYLDDKGTNINLISESLQGHSEAEYNSLSDKNIKTLLGVDNITSDTKIINSHNVRFTHYTKSYDNKNITIHQATFYNNDKAYIFTIAGINEISVENMKSFDNLLNTVQFN